LALRNPELARELHAAVDRAKDLSSLTLANFEVEMASREVEIDRRAAGAQLRAGEGRHG